MIYTENTLIKKGDVITITKNVYYVENPEEEGLTTEEPVIIIYFHKGRNMVAQNSGHFEDVMWWGDGRESGLQVEWVN